jgi:tetratricopeptide (TPR) repeat protein
LFHFSLEYLEGDREHAKQHFDAVIKLDPSNTSALFDLAMVCTSLEKNVEAMSHFRNILKIDPTLEEARFQVSVSSHSFCYFFFSFDFTSKKKKKWNILRINTFLSVYLFFFFSLQCCYYQNR